MRLSYLCEDDDEDKSIRVLKTVMAKIRYDDYELGISGIKFSDSAYLIQFCDNPPPTPILKQPTSSPWRLHAGRFVVVKDGVAFAGPYSLIIKYLNKSGGGTAVEGGLGARDEDANDEDISVIKLAIQELKDENLFNAVMDQMIRECGYDDDEDGADEAEDD